MTREELIHKWLDHELNENELEAFKQLEDYKDLTKLDRALHHFKAKETDIDAAYTNVKSSIAETQTKNNSWLKPLLRIAAVLIIGFGAYFYTATPETNTIETLASHKTSIELPDTSSVTLNALSSLTFSQDSWEEKRTVNLKGEAYFKVAKGESFDVITKAGTVTVLGTQFNVKQRKNLFEVVCFEGSVKVVHKEYTRILKPGDRFLMLQGKLIEQNGSTQTEPTWIHNESSFKSMPVIEAIRELERQYDVIVDVSKIDTSQIFTGRFTHDDIKMALKSITIPTALKFHKKQDSIILTRGK